MTTTTTDPHTCHATDCETPVPPRMFMCRRHWYMVPKPMRDALWAAYRPGQERDMHPSEAWFDAAFAAIAYVEGREGVKR